MAREIYKTNIITSKSYDELEVLDNHFIEVEDGIITNISKDNIEEDYIDYSDYIMIPAFSDLHIHASQFVQRGIGMDCLLFDWLNNYTFPQESKFKDREYAKIIYPQLIKELLKHGTFHASFFTTIHYEACDLFFEMLKNSPMYAYSGKINMDQNSPDYYIEDCDKSLKESEEFIIKHLGHERIKPIITPRFAPTCSEKLLKGLGDIAYKYDVAIQTHLVESKAEAAWAKELYPQYLSDGDIYDKCGFLRGNSPKIFAHVIFPTNVEEELLRRDNCYCVHCPDATNNIIAGIMPVNYLHEKNIKIALGSDIGGGHYIGLYRQISKSIQLSKMKEFYEEDHKHISFKNAFYMATSQGGEIFGKVGKIEKGYKFNTLVINKMEDEGHKLSLEESLERFCYIGDDRDIKARYIDGKYIDVEEVYNKLIKMD